MARHSEQTPEVARDEIIVSIGTLGGTLRTVVLNQEATVADALSVAGLDAGSEVRCNGEVYRGDDKVDQGDTLIVISGAKVQGAL